MPRTCTICTHPERATIDKALVDGETSNLSLSSLFGVSEAAIRRHRRAHLPAALVKATDAAQVAQADDLLTQVRNLQQRSLDILQKAENSGDLRTALSAVGQARACLELSARLAGELRDSQVQVAVLIASPEWAKLRDAILAALESYPDARLAVAEAIRC